MMGSLIVDQSWGRRAAIKAYAEGSLSVALPSNVAQWAKERGWPTPFWGLKKAIIERMLSCDEEFFMATQYIDTRISESIYAEFHEQFGSDTAYRAGPIFRGKTRD